VLRGARGSGGGCRRKRGSRGFRGRAHLGGGDGRVAVGGMQRRLAAVSQGGGALVHFRPWEGAEQVYLGERMLETTSVCSARALSRRIGAAN
jgi:hypothetical protein